MKKIDEASRKAGRAVIDTLAAPSRAVARMMSSTKRSDERTRAARRAAIAKARKKK